MRPGYDAIIVGSGPAGVSAAFPLVAAGLKVLMLDGGRQAQVPPPSLPFLRGRETEPGQWHWMVGKDFHALRHLGAISPKLRTPTHNYVFEGFSAANRIDARDFVAVGSLAQGGLSNAWGCGVARLSAEELREFPFPAADLDRSYEAVARRIGVSGALDDDLSGYFGLDDWSQPPLAMDALHTRLLARYTARRSRLAASGLRLGRARVAALSQEHAGRLACDHSGNCLWGCHRHALYSAADELPILRQHDNFHHQSGFVVTRIVQAGNGYSVEGEDVSGGKLVHAGKVILAAGTLATTRLALQALDLRRPVPLLCSPTAAFLLWLPGMWGTPRTGAFGYGQLSFSLSSADSSPVFGSTFSTTGIPMTEFLSHLPLRKRFGIDLLRELLGSCLVGNVFLPGYLSSSSAMLQADASLIIEGGQADRLFEVMAGIERRLRQACLSLGAFLVPSSFKVGAPGADIHYAGTLPMRARPKPGETDAMGRLAGMEGVYIVDGASLPNLTEKPHTLTLMANADRIARHIAQQHPIHYQVQPR